MGDGDTSDLMARLLAAAERARELGGSAAATLGDGVEDGLSALVGRRVQRATSDQRHTAAEDVVDAIDPAAGGVVSRLGSAGASRLARRVSRARAITARTPAGLALRYGPAVVSGVQSDLRSIDAAAGFVVSRARSAGIEPDPVRVERVVVQALAGIPVDPDAPAAHATLARRWVKDLGRQLSPVPDGSGRSRRAAAVVGALADLDVARLA